MARFHALDVHLALFICIEARNHIQKSRFAAAGFSCDHYKLAGVKIHVDLGYAAGDYTFAIVKLRDVFQSYHSHSGNLRFLLVCLHRGDVFIIDPSVLPLVLDKNPVAFPSFFNDL